MVNVDPFVCEIRNIKTKRVVLLVPRGELLLQELEG